MDIDSELRQISSILGTCNEEAFRIEDLQTHIDRVWQIIDKNKRSINDIVLNKICSMMTKLAIVIDAYKAKMIRFENLKVYIEREKLANNLVDISKTVI